jgi:hypothetical protein
MRERFSEHRYECLRYFIGDVRDRDRLYRAFDPLDLFDDFQKDIPKTLKTLVEIIKKSIAKDRVDTAILLCLGMQGILIGRLLGAHVTATSRNDEKLDMAKTLGADLVINTARDNFVEVSKSRVGSFDVVIDNIGTRFLQVYSKLFAIL